MRDTVLAQRIFTGLGEASRASEGRVAYSQIPEDCQKTSAYSQKTDAFSKGTSKASKGITESQLGAPKAVRMLYVGRQHHGTQDQSLDTRVKRGSKPAGSCT